MLSRFWPTTRHSGSEQTSSLPWLVDHGRTMLIICRLTSGLLREDTQHCEQALMGERCMLALLVRCGGG